MRILLTADPELPVPPREYGGIERIVSGLAATLRARGHEVGLMAHPESTAAVDQLFRWPATQSRGGGNSLRNAIALRGAVRRFRPDVIHSYSRLLYLLTVLDDATPRVMSYQRRPTRRTAAWSRRLAGTRLTFTGCSEHICRAGRRAGGTWEAIPNFVELDRFPFAASVPADAPVLFLGRVEPIKGVHLAIAASRASGRRLLIAGNHGSAGEAGRYWREEIVPQLGSGDVEYVGAVDDATKGALLRRCAALLAPVQWDEPFGIVFIEALASGTPVISCPRGALPEIVRNGLEGFLTEGVPRLAQAITRLDAIDRHACRARAETTYSADVVVRQYERLYSALVAPTATAREAPCTS